MPEVFYGPWSISVDSKDSVFEQRFVIQGSDSSDGTYPGTTGTSVAVTGKQWTVTMEWLDGSTWQPSGVRRSATYTLQEGVVVTLAADDSPAGVADQDYNDLMVVMKYEDPSLNPLRPSGNPYDFTIPEGAIVRGEH
jgi:hypothetical protein